MSILLCGCESWTLTSETEIHMSAFEMKCFRRLFRISYTEHKTSETEIHMSAFEMKCFRRLFRISYTEHKTNDYARQQADSFAGKQESLLTTVKRRKLSWFGHITRHNTISKSTLQGTLEGTRRPPEENCLDKMQEWANESLPTLVRTEEDKPR